jgi:hypothetical protein
MWEYMAIDLNNTRRGENDMDLLNDAGADGWELVAITAPFRGILKRRRLDVENASRDTGSKNSAVAVKYRNPETGETWSGRGRMASWLAAKVKAGKRAEDYLVHAAEAHVD